MTHHNAKPHDAGPEPANPGYPTHKHAVLFMSGLLHAERVRRGTRAGRRALGSCKQAVLVLRWFLDDIRMWLWPGTAR